MSFELPHVEDLETNSKLPGQLTENFKTIEQEDADLRELIQKKHDELQQNSNHNHDELSDRIDKLNERLDELMNGGGMQ